MILQYLPEDIGNAERTVNTGYVFHLVKVKMPTPINLRIDEITKHLFVSGATGVGKSNFYYQLLDQLTDLGIKVLIIERLISF